MLAGRLGDVTNEKGLRGNPEEVTVCRMDWSWVRTRVRVISTSMCAFVRFRAKVEVDGGCHWEDMKVVGRVYLGHCASEPAIVGSRQSKVERSGVRDSATTCVLWTMDR